MQSDRPNIVRAAGFGVLALGALGLTAFSALMSAGELAPGLAGPLAAFLPLATAHSEPAQQAFARGDLADARRQTMAELQVSPVREGAWLRLVKIETAARGRLDAPGLQALDHAYDAAPYDLSVSADRRRFAGAHLSDLTPDLKSQLDQEIAALGR